MMAGDLMIPILYQDRQLAVCLKPPGVLSQEGPGDTLPSLLSRQLGGEIFPVHRLDRGVGGVMVCARTSRSAAALSSSISQGAFQKQYLCVVQGRPERETDQCRDLLLHDRTRNKSFVVTRMRGGVKEARLDYRLLSSSGGLSLLQVRLHTGRTHQIRVQLSSRGLPLLGDGKYGGGSGQIALWSAALSFPHLSDSREMAFHALPQGGVWDPFGETLQRLSPDSFAWSP